MIRNFGGIILLSLLTVADFSTPARYDFVVYGGTAGGIIAAVAAAREGLRVALLEPGNHLGGMVSGGLGITDHGKKEVIGGYALEFFQRVGRHYQEPITWYFEPHVAERVFLDMIRQAGVEVFYQHRLKEKLGVRKKGTTIESIHLENGREFRAELFADCTYEGDLMAQSGISYTWGREGTIEYGESLAGVRPRDKNHMFMVSIPARDAKGNLWPEISPAARGDIGTGDKRVQAYNFRVCLSRDKNNQVPFPKPADYNAARYALLQRLIEATAAKTGQPPRLGDLMHVQMIPNQKTDINNNGAFSTDYIGKNYGYPESGYKERAEIWQDHKNYIQGFFYYLAHDPAVPVILRDEVNQWGLAKDEFQDSGHWPHQLYVREARRMAGSYVMTQKDIQTELTKPDVIGMGSYNSDSHNVQRYEAEDGTVQNEGNMEVPVAPYQIPYRIMLPKKAEATNLLVPVCFSASHVAYSTLRMEPQYMIIGHAAGVAASLASRQKRALQEIDVDALRAKLRSQRAVFYWDQAGAK
jgi:hypothetical protein